MVGDFNDYIFNKTLYLNEAVFGALVTGLNPFSTLIEIFIFVCNKLLLINDDLSRQCGLCPEGWE